MIIDSIIEIPYNTFIKYEYDPKYSKIRCDRILNTSMLYPGNYGYIPNTLAGDDDPFSNQFYILCEGQSFPRFSSYIFGSRRTILFSEKFRISKGPLNPGLGDSS